MRDERLVRFVERKVAQARHEHIHFLEVQPPMSIFQDLHDIGEVVVVAQLVAAELPEDVSRLHGLAVAGEVSDGLREVVLWQVFQAGDSLGQPLLPWRSRRACWPRSSPTLRGCRRSGRSGEPLLGSQAGLRGFLRLPSYAFGASLVSS